MTGLRLRGSLAVWLAALWLAVAPAVAQTSAALDYDAWNRVAVRAEALVAGGIASVPLLEQVRGRVADWRAAFLAAQGDNGARITTLRGQLAALGPAPADGAADAPEIAERRRALTAQLLQLQSPVIAAEEAYSRADGLIREIDRQLRERQAAALTRLLPSPLNPANWPAGLKTLRDEALDLGTEALSPVTDPGRRAAVLARMPGAVGLTVLAVLLLWRGRRWFDALPAELMAGASLPRRRVLAFAASLGQIVVPLSGLHALVAAIRITGIPGPQILTLLDGLLAAGLAVFFARWLAFRLFPEDGAGPFAGTGRGNGWLWTVLLGLLSAVEVVRRVVFDPLRLEDAAEATLAFPGIAVTGLVLVRLGFVIRARTATAHDRDEPATYRDRMVALLARLSIATGIAGPLLGAVGYLPAAHGTVYPMALSLGLAGLILVLQQLSAEVFAWITGGEAAREGLGPVLTGFVLTVLSLPLFALIWGVRGSDLLEVYSRLREGFTLGGARISPGSFLVFALVFAAGYGATRLFQGALKSTVLPKTRLDPGGQNAVVSGTGYVGIFLAALAAINAAGIDLSGLAIVAGALSVGLGFGLQTIVSNFVSGIILLIERPVSEGDWIEVGPVSGIVKAISVRSTRIQTFDRADVIVPNADLVTGRVTNWTRFNLSGRLVVPVAVPFTEDSRVVEATLRGIVAALPAALPVPPPVVLFTGFGPEAMLFEIRLILRDVNTSPEVRSEINHQIARRFAEEGICLSAAQRDFRLRQAAEAAAATLDEEALDALLKERPA
jgi:small-conductance mechanosensitive channel